MTDFAELGRRGGEATKRKLKADPNYFKALGRMGGLANQEKNGKKPDVAAQRKKAAREATDAMIRLTAAGLVLEDD